MLSFQAACCWNNHRKLLMDFFVSIFQIFIMVMTSELFLYISLAVICIKAVAILVFLIYKCSRRQGVQLSEVEASAHAWPATNQTSAWPSQATNQTNLWPAQATNLNFPPTYADTMASSPSNTDTGTYANFWCLEEFFGQHHELFGLKCIMSKYFSHTVVHFTRAGHASF